MNKLFPLGAVLCAALIFGSSGAFIKYLQLPPLTLSFFRTFIPAFLVGIYCLSRNKLKIRKHFSIILLGSILNAIRLGFYFYGFSHSNISSAIIVLYTWPVFTTINAGLFLKEKTRLYHYVLLFIAMSGIIIINADGLFNGHRNSQIIGLCSVLISAIIYSFSIICFKKVANEYSSLETVFWQNAIGALTFIPALFFFPFPTLVQTAVSSLYAILIGIIGFSLVFYGLRRLPATTVSLLNYAEVASGIFFGIIMYQERPGWIIFFGGSLIILASITGTMLSCKNKYLLKTDE